MTLLSRAIGASIRTRRGAAALAAWAAGYAAVSAALGVILTDPLLGALTGHPWELFGIGSLIVFAVSMTTAALTALLGLGGTIVSILLFVLLGNPTSGGSVPVQMMTGGFRLLSKVLPNNVGVSAVRSAQYFGGSQIGHPLLVLALYAGIAAVAFFSTAAYRSRPRLHPEHAAAHKVAA
jgi:ABC-type multidrug transport system permease subunit